MNYVYGITKRYSIYKGVSNTQFLVGFTFQIINFEKK